MNFIIEDGILKKYVGCDSEAIIPDSVTSIGIGAFEGCNIKICTPKNSSVFPAMIE